MKPFIHKYRPKKVAGIFGQNKGIDELRGFVRNFGAGKKSVLVYGPTGSGKTCAVHAIANELNYEVIEVNASDVRNKEEIEKVLGSASQQMSLFNKGKIILVDEIDGVSGRKDRGGLASIAKIIDKTAFPIIMTANDPWDSKFSGLRKKSHIIKFHTLNYLSIFNVLQSICKSEGIKYDENSLKSLARVAGGDMRAAINDLQIITQGTNEIGKNDIDALSHRNKEQSMINALMRIFKTKNLKIALESFEDVAEDSDKRMLWLDENLPKEYTKPKDLMNAYECLAKADVFRGRIRRWQHWRFLVYMNALMSGGVALSKDEKYKGFVKYGPTKRILKLWQANISYAKRKSIVDKIVGKSSLSKKEATNFIPYLKQIVKSKGMAEDIYTEFKLDEAEIQWLKK